MDVKQSAGWAGLGIVTADGETLVWRPKFDVNCHLYRGFELRLTDLRGDGKRRIRPASGFALKEGSRIGPSAYFYDARIGGLAVWLARGLDPERLQIQGTAWLITKKLLSSRTLLRRRFTGPADFRISRQMREATGRWSVVPAELSGELLDVAGLMRLGNHEATRRGIKRPSREQVVHLGLYAAARSNPLRPADIPDDGIGRSAKLRRLVRSALLDDTLAPDDVTDEELEIVMERFADAVEPHLGDEPDDFDRWFDGPNNSLVKQIAQQRTARGGELDPARVTAALAELGWRGLRLGAECVEFQMRAVAADLPEPLAPEDLARYEAVYYRQPWVGGLSVCLLWGRFDFLREAIWDVTERPDDDLAVGTMIRLLQYYSDAASLRREVDRQRKRRATPCSKARK